MKAVKVVCKALCWVVAGAFLTAGGLAAAAGSIGAVTLGVIGAVAGVVAALGPAVRRRPGASDKT